MPRNFLKSSICETTSRKPWFAKAWRLHWRFLRQVPPPTCASPRRVLVGGALSVWTHEMELIPSGPGTQRGVQKKLALMRGKSADNGKYEVTLNSTETGLLRIPSLNKEQILNRWPSRSIISWSCLWQRTCTLTAGIESILRTQTVFFPWIN